MPWFRKWFGLPFPKKDIHKLASPFLVSRIISHAAVGPRMMMASVFTWLVTKIDQFYGPATSCCMDDFFLGGEGIDDVAYFLSIYDQVAYISSCSLQDVTI